jgi:secreted PhoX family phosphatase
VVFDLEAEKVEGDPDGMTIDTKGNLWVACFNSNHVSLYNGSFNCFLLFLFNFSRNDFPYEFRFHF